MFPIRLVLVEDHSQMREALTRLLSEHCNVVQTLGRGDTVLSVIADSLPDVVVLDISLPGLSGFQVLKKLRYHFPHLAIVLLSSHDSDVYRRTALARGADAFVSKSDATKQLWISIEAAVKQRTEARVAESAPARIG